MTLEKTMEKAKKKKQINFVVDRVDVHLGRAFE